MSNSTISDVEKQLRLENRELFTRLTEAEETINAIRNGEVDAIVVNGTDGPKIFSLTSAETPYRIMIEEMNEGAATLTADGTILFCNRSFAEFVSVPIERAIGANVLTFIAESEKLNFERLLNSGLTGKFKGEISFPNPDNSQRFFNLSFSPLPSGESGDVCCVISNEITVLKEKEEELQNARVFLNSIIENSPNALWISDESGTLIRMNQALRNNLHLRDDEVIGKYNIFRDNLLEEQGFMPLVRNVFEKGISANFVTSYDTGKVKGLEIKQPVWTYYPNPESELS
jgi:PAS domain S-box-containing protein